MAARDPETGQFVSGGAAAQYDDIEVVSIQADVGVQAADLDGSTGFVSGQTFDAEAVPLVDYDEVVDRNEELHLLQAQHHLVAHVNSTGTADGEVRAYVEISTSPTRQVSPTINASAGGGDLDAGVVGRPDSDDSIDVIGRPLLAVGFGPFSDGATGVGGGGSAGRDSVDMGPLPREIGRFHPRDDLFLNSEIRVWNIADRGVHLDLQGQHVYGVVSE